MVDQAATKTVDRGATEMVDQAATKLVKLDQAATKLAKLDQAATKWLTKLSTKIVDQVARQEWLTELRQKNG